MCKDQKCDTRPNMCDTCEANEMKISLLTKNIRWMAEILNLMTGGDSKEYIRICAELQTATDKNFSRGVIDFLIGEKQIVEERITNQIKI